MKKLLLCLLVLLAISPSYAQRPGSKDSAPLPLQGKALPEVSAVNEEGEIVQLQQLLQGKHAVIVFGCLT